MKEKQAMDSTNNKKVFRRRARVEIPVVSTSPRTLKVMEENEKFLVKYANKQFKTLIQQ